MTFELGFEGEMDLDTWKWPKALQGREQNEQSPTGRDVGGVRVEQWTNRSFGTSVRDHECHTRECGFSCPGHTAEAPGELVKADYPAPPSELGFSGPVLGPESLLS